MTVFGMGARAAVLAGALALAGTASAGGDKAATSGTSTSGTSSSGMSSSKKASHELTGRVEKFDHDAKTFTVAGQDLKVDSSTKVMKDGKAASLTDVREGDEIRASYSGSGSAMTAHRIDVMSKSGSSSGMSSGTTSGTSEAPAGRSSTAAGTGTSTSQGDSAGTTSGTGASTGTPADATQSSGAAQTGGNK